MLSEMQFPHESRSNFSCIGNTQRLQTSFDLCDPGGEHFPLQSKNGDFVSPDWRRHTPQSSFLYKYFDGASCSWTQTPRQSLFNDVRDSS